LATELDLDDVLQPFRERPAIECEDSIALSRSEGEGSEVCLAIHRHKRGSQRLHVREAIHADESEQPRGAPSANGTCDYREHASSRRHRSLPTHVRPQCVVKATASASSDLTPRTMLLASADSSRRCAICSRHAPTATAGIPMLTAMLASVEPTSAGT